jgi:hypothetical protein
MRMRTRDLHGLKVKRSGLAGCVLEPDRECQP